MFIEIAKSLFADIWYIAGKLFSSQTRFTYLGRKLIDMNARETVVLDKLFADNYCVLKVKPVKGNKTDKNVSAKRQYPFRRTAAVRYDLPFFNFFTELDNGFLVQARSLVQAEKFRQLYFLGMVNYYPRRVNCCYGSALRRSEQPCSNNAQLFLPYRYLPAGPQASAMEPPDAACSNPSTHGWRRHVRGME